MQISPMILMNLIIMNVRIHVRISVAPLPQRIRPNSSSKYCGLMLVYRKHHGFYIQKIVNRHTLINKPQKRSVKCGKQTLTHSSPLEIVQIIILKIRAMQLISSLTSRCDQLNNSPKTASQSRSHNKKQASVASALRRCRTTSATQKCIVVMYACSSSIQRHGRCIQ